MDKYFLFFLKKIKVFQLFFSPVKFVKQYLLDRIMSPVLKRGSNEDTYPIKEL